MTVVHDFSFSVGSMVLDFMERLRAVLGSKSWDYCIVWWLSEDRRSLKWLDCCCAGAENVDNGEEHLLGVSTANTCRDVMFPHPRTNACDLLAHLPSVVPLNSGIYAESLISNQTKWLNFSLDLDAALSEEAVGTRVLIPLQLGLVELFATKQFPEDPDMIEFITAQLNVMTLEEQAMIQSHTAESDLSVNLNRFHDAPSASEDRHNDFMPVTLQDNIDVLMDHMQLKSFPMNFTQNFSYPSGGTGSKNNVMLFEGHHNGNPEKGSIDDGLNDMDDFQKHMMSHHGNMFMHTTEPAAEKEDPGNDNDSLKQENGLSNSMSENDEEDDARYRRRSGRGQAKNLQAERNRRKKLNGRLYALRSLVPNISKLDRASILGDAIEYVKELEKQVKDLENELEEHSDEENQGIAKSTAGNHTGLQTETFWQNGKRYRHKSEDDESSNRSHKGTSSGKGGFEHVTHDKMQQMEPQVEVAQLDGNEFFIRVFCEHKPGGFVRLMEALNSLGFEVTNVNSTRHTCLVSNIFKVERRDSEMLEADHVRDSLLELTRNPSRGWVEMMNASENGGQADGVSQHHHQNHHLHHQFHNRQIMSSHHLHHLHN